MNFPSIRLHRLRKPLVVAVSGWLVLLLLIVIYVLFLGPLLSIDLTVWEAAQLHRSDTRTAAMMLVTRLADVLGAVVLIAVGVVWFRRLPKRQLSGALLSVAMTIPLQMGLKWFFARARPDFSQALLVEESLSYPSGHTMVAVVLYGWLAYLVLRSHVVRSVRVAAVLAAVVISLSVGVSRVYLGVHWLSDVVAGYVVGLWWLLLTIWYVRRAS